MEKKGKLRRLREQRLTLRRKHASAKARDGPSGQSQTCYLLERSLTKFVCGKQNRNYFSAGAETEKQKFRLEKDIDNSVVVKH